MFIAKNPAGTVFLDDNQDPALLNSTYFPSLTAALMRLKVRYAGCPTERAALVDGIRDIILKEHQFGAPTEQEMNEHYLTINNWQRDEAGAWIDPLSNAAYEFANALEIQEGRDMQDDKAAGIEFPDPNAQPCGGCGHPIGEHNSDTGECWLCACGHAVIVPIDYNEYFGIH